MSHTGSVSKKEMSATASSCPVSRTEAQMPRSQGMATPRSQRIATPKDRKRLRLELCHRPMG